MEKKNGLMLESLIAGFIVGLTHAIPPARSRSRCYDVASQRGSCPHFRST